MISQFIHEILRLVKLPAFFTTVTPFSKIIALFLFVLLPFMGFYLGMKYQEKIDLQTKQLEDLVKIKNSQNPVLTPTFMPTPTIKVVEITPQPASSFGSWKTYTDQAVGFSLRYPETTLIQKDFTDGSEKSSLGIFSEKIDDIVKDLPYARSKEDAFAEKAALEKGIYEGNFDFESLKEILKIGNNYSKSYIVFGRFETCNIVFERTPSFIKIIIL